MEEKNMVKNLRWNDVLFSRRKLRVNRKYKDRLFRFLFRERKDLLQLYNAVNGSNYADPEELEIVTLEDVIFMGIKNDLSFMIADSLNLYEHQSTYAPNMPLRGLLYLSRQYEGIVEERGENLYGSKLVKLPTPAYVVFYNGTKEQPDRTELYLSDAFEAGRGSGCLECKAVMLNINRGHNPELMEKCRRLWEYSEFVSEVNDNLAKGYSLKSAITTATNHCIEKGILKDVLLKSKAEVMHMLLTEYDAKKHLEDTYDEGREEGREEGRKEGYYEHLEKQVHKKVSKGKTLEEMAEELEEDIETIREIIKNM